MSDHETSLLTRKQAAEFLGQLGWNCSPQTLANYASNDNSGHGPPFIRFGWRAVRYRPDDLHRWFRRQSVRIE